MYKDIYIYIDSDIYVDGYENRYADPILLVHVHVTVGKSKCKWSQLHEDMRDFLVYIIIHHSFVMKSQELSMIIHGMCLMESSWSDMTVDYTTTISNAIVRLFSEENISNHDVQSQHLSSILLGLGTAV